MSLSGNWRPNCLNPGCVTFSSSVASCKRRVVHKIPPYFCLLYYFKSSVDLEPPTIASCTISTHPQYHTHTQKYCVCELPPSLLLHPAAHLLSRCTLPLFLFKGKPIPLPFPFASSFSSFSSSPFLSPFVERHIMLFLFFLFASKMNCSLHTPGLFLFLLSATPHSSTHFITAIIHFCFVFLRYIRENIYFYFY